MLDFYTELKKFERAPEPKELNKFIKEERKDMIDLAVSIIYKNNKPNRHFEGDE